MELGVEASVGMLEKQATIHVTLFCIKKNGTIDSVTLHNSL